jgi:WD repeat-containing protein 76
MAEEPTGSDLGTDYERLRLENIKRNAEFLESIGIDSVKEVIKPQVASNRKSSARKPIQKVKSVPARRSSRISLISIQSMLDEAKETGNDILLEEAESKRKLMELPLEERSIQIEESSTTKLLKGEPLSMASHLFQGDDDESNGGNLLELLGKMTESDCRSQMVGEVEYSKLSLSEDHVAKVTKSRITTSAFHPSVSKTIIAAGDKEGHVGLWTPDDHDSMVYLYKPHTSNICSIFVNPMNPDQLWSVSYDSTIRYTNIEHRSFVQSYRVESEGYLTDACYVGTKSQHSSDLVYVSSSCGNVQLVDFRAATSQWSSEAYDGNLDNLIVIVSL